MHGQEKSRRRGLTLLEVLVALLLLAALLFALTRSASRAQAGKDPSRGTGLVHSVMLDLEAQPYDALVSFNGRRFLDGDAPQRSSWAVDLAVFQAGVDLVQVDATLTELESGHAVAQLCTLRSRR
jgi:prepilin-type N-terminal cleavage/methylation domain-containing protein